MAEVISVINQKGGVGKTTTSINVAYFLAKAGKKVLLVDFDPQGNASSGLGVDKKGLELTMTEVITGEVGLDKVVVPTRCKGLVVAPATPKLANAEVVMAGMNKKFILLRSAIAKVAQFFDYIIIDCPPSLSLLTVNAMIASDWLLLPVQTEFYALEGVSQLLESMKLVKKAMNPRVKLLGVVATMHDKRTALSGQVLHEIKKYFKGMVFNTTIPRNVRLAEAPSHGVAIGQYDKFSKGSRAYEKLTKEILKKIEGGGKKK